MSNPEGGYRPPSPDNFTASKKNMINAFITEVKKLFVPEERGITKLHSIKNCQHKE